MLEYTTSQITRTYGVHPNTVLLAIAMGRLQARRAENGNWLVEGESLARWQRQRVRRASKAEQPGVKQEVAVAG